LSKTRAWDKEAGEFAESVELIRAAHVRTKQALELKRRREEVSTKKVEKLNSGLPQKLRRLACGIDPHRRVKEQSTGDKRERKAERTAG
jgi:hypothetical protein